MQNTLVGHNAVASGHVVVSADRPVIVVGFQKAGTSSVYDYFRCGDVPSTHWRCQKKSHSKNSTCTCTWLSPQERKCTGACREGLCAECVFKNLQKDMPPLHNCGQMRHQKEVHVWAQLDSTWPLDGPQGRLYECFWPQLFSLPKFARAYPNATWVLNTRPFDHWLASFTRWRDLRNRTTTCLLNAMANSQTLLADGSGAMLTGGSDEDYSRFFAAHHENVRAVAKRHGIR
jgi:hypothetical protein